jgi:hypothetical protein
MRSQSSWKSWPGQPRRDQPDPLPGPGTDWEGESPEQHRQVRQVRAALTVCGELRLFTAQDGAEGPSQLNNPSQMQVATFDWLNER